jgi:hypothetical protein
MSQNRPCSCPIPGCRFNTHPTIEKILSGYVVIKREFPEDEKDQGEGYNQ